MWKSHYFNHVNKEHVITVEQGSRFLLKLELNAKPWPTSVHLYKNGKIVRSSEWATIFPSVDRMCIPTVYGQNYAGRYKIKATNLEGEGHIIFQLKVQGNHTTTASIV